MLKLSFMPEIINKMAFFIKIATYSFMLEIIVNIDKFFVGMLTTDVMVAILALKLRFYIEIYHYGIKFTIAIFKKFTLYHIKFLCASNLFVLK